MCCLPTNVHLLTLVLIVVVKGWIMPDHACCFRVLEHSWYVCALYIRFIICDTIYKPDTTSTLLSLKSCSTQKYYLTRHSENVCFLFTLVMAWSSFTKDEIDYSMGPSVNMTDPLWNEKCFLYPTSPWIQLGNGIKNHWKRMTSLLLPFSQLHLHQWSRVREDPCLRSEPHLSVLLLLISV